MTPIDIICELKALEQRIAELERARSEVSSSSLLDCAAWHDAQAAQLRREVAEYPREKRMAGTEAVYLDASTNMANQHEAWARIIREQSKREEFLLERAREAQSDVNATYNLVDVPYAKRQA